MSHSNQRLQMNGQWIGYWFVRAGLAAAGLFALLSTALFQFGAPDLLYDVPEPPPLRERLPAIVFGALLLLPHRWTMRGFLFWPRLILSVPFGLFLVYAGVSAILAGLRGGRDPLIYPAGLGFMLLGVAVPACLWWRRHLTCGRK